eukprot:gene9754-13123_t
MQQVDAATERIIKQDDVLLLGEGSFSFSTSLAARRGSWSGICATEYVREIPDYNEVKFLQVSNAVKELPNDQNISRDRLKPLFKIIELGSDELDGRLWIFGIDANRLQEFF